LWIVDLATQLARLDIMENGVSVFGWRRQSTRLLGKDGRWEGVGADLKVTGKKKVREELELEEYSTREHLVLVSVYPALSLHFTPSNYGIEQ